MADRTNRVRLLFLALLCLLFLSSCAFTTLVNSTLPSWVEYPVSSANQFVWVTEGSSPNSFNARLEALEGVLDNLSGEIGEDVREKWYRELTTSDQIRELDLKITREFRKDDTTYLMAVCSRKLVAERRSDVVKLSIERDERIAALLSKADSAYRENRDVEAAAATLEALEVCATGQCSYRVSEMVKRAVSVISSVRISILKSDSRSAGVSCKLRRKQLFFNPRIEDAAVIASFPSRDVWGDDLTDSVRIRGDEKGNLVFRPYTASMAFSGSVELKIDIADQMAALEEVLSEQDYQKLLKAWKSVSYQYELTPPYKGEKVLVNVKKLSSKGEVLDHSAELEFLLDFLSSRGMECEVDDDQFASSSDLVEELARSPLPARYLVYASFGEVERVDSVFDTMVTSGQLQLWDIPNQELLGDTSAVKITGEGQESFRKLFRVIEQLALQFL